MLKVIGMWRVGSTTTVGNNSIIELRNVTAGYYVAEGFKTLKKVFKPVITNINLKVNDGERLAIIGESGSGKTTLLRVILGLLPPLQGDVVVVGERIYRIPARLRWRVTRQIGYVPQDPAKSLNPRLRIADVMAEPLARVDLSEREKTERIKDALRIVQLHELILSYYPSQLSGGMMQRVLIARAIVHDPEMLLLDEPTSALDVSIQAQIIDLLCNIQKKLELAMVTVTHDLPVAQYLADRAVILYRGAIVEEGPLGEIMAHPRSEHARLLITSYLSGLNGLNGVNRAGNV